MSAPKKLPSRKTRAPGRPTVKAAGNLRERMLTAAAELFAEHGVAGTSLNGIARTVGATPAMVHYYFKNKESLIDAFVSERLGPLVADVWSAVDDEAMKAGEMTLLETSENIVRRLIDVAVRDPKFPALWVREIVYEKGFLRDRLLQFLPQDKMACLAQGIRAEQKAGRISPDLEPRFFVVSLVGLTLLPMATMSLWGRFPELKGFSPERLARHVMALIQYGAIPPVKESKMTRKPS